MIKRKRTQGKASSSSSGKAQACCDPNDMDSMCCCNVESIISVDERGQMVLPKDIRKQANIKPGDKLALVTWKVGGEVACIALFKTDELAGMVKGYLGPMMKETFG